MDQEDSRKLFVPSTIHRNRIHSLPLPVQRKSREELQEEGTHGLIYNLERWDPLEVQQANVHGKQL
jgi:hypothetical protein